MLIGILSWIIIKWRCHSVDNGREDFAYFAAALGILNCIADFLVRKRRIFVFVDFFEEFSEEGWRGYKKGNKEEEIKWKKKD